MTRKQALHKALEVLERIEEIDDFERFEHVECAELKRKISEILEDMPFTGWSERTIFDTIDQFIDDNDRMPLVSDFKKKGLPPHTVIKLRFGITLREFLDQYYPAQKLCNSQFYYTKSKEHWRDVFIAEYRKNKPTSAELYNSTRSEGVPSWGTVAKMFGIGKWYEWLYFCEIVPFVGKREPKQGKTKSVQIRLTKEINIPGEPGLSALMMERFGGIHRG